MTRPPVAGKRASSSPRENDTQPLLAGKTKPLTIIRVMDIDRIITMASQGVRIQFLAFERSLRAVGCDLPLLVIPYDQDDKFDLPRNAEWWQKEEFASWLKEHQAHPTWRSTLSHRGKLRLFRYRYLLHRGLPHNLSSADWICRRGYRTDQVWRSLHTGVDGSALQGNQLWPLKLFNTGHFASDTPLYSLADLESTCEKYKETCLLSPHHEQPGINLLAIVLRREIYQSLPAAL